MNVRRGWALAGIHLVIATGMFVWNESPFWHMFRAGDVSSRGALQRIAWQEDGGIAFNPCAPGGWIDRQNSPMETIMAAQIGFLGFAGAGHVPCSSESGIERLIESGLGARTKRSEAVIGVVTCVAIAIQWLLVGGFPLVRPRHWWLEPGTFITACTCLGTALLCADGLFLLARRDALSDPGLIIGIGVYRLVLLPALVMWLVWFGLLLWRAASAILRLVRARSHAN